MPITNVLLLAVTVLPLATSAATSCKDSTFEQSDINEAIAALNQIRQDAFDGKYENGMGGLYNLPSAPITSAVEWDCDLEDLALKYLKTFCTLNEPVTDITKTYLGYCCGFGTKSTAVEAITYFGDSAQDEVIPIQSGYATYSGDMNVRLMANILREAMTKVGCSQLSCDEDSDFPVYFTVCITDQPELAKGEIIYGANIACPAKTYMDDFIRLAFLSKHNALRTTLALGTATNGNTGNNARSAVNMPQLVYDCGLESAAYERAKLCESFTPESLNTLKENSFNYTHRERTFQKAAQLATQFWWSELKKSEGLEQIQNIFYTHLGINHFAKIGSDLTTKVGCGIYNCTSIVNIVCRYETTLANAKKLYVPGPKCNKCKDTCANALCPATVVGAKFTA